VRLRWYVSSSLSLGPRHTKGTEYVLAKRPLGDTPTSWTSRYHSSRMFDVLPITTHTPLVAVEDWGDGQVTVFAPVPVRLGAFVFTLGFQSGFICPVLCKTCTFGGCVDTYQI
jgi:hypothetical protein